MRTLLGLTALLLVLGAGCSRDITVLECGQPGDAAGGDAVVDQAGGGDVSAPDTGPLVGDPLVGAACGTDGDCPTDEGWSPWCLSTAALSEAVPVFYAVTDGLCSLPACESDADCGPRGVCVNGGGLDYCALACESFLDCRYVTGFACAAIGGAAPACVPEGAIFLAQCGDGVCDEDERYDANRCPADCPDGVPVPALTGGPCVRDGDCAAGTMCFTSPVLSAMVGSPLEVPGGMCANNPLAASCTGDDQCGEGGACVDATALAGIPVRLCLHACQDDGDCRILEGYRCFDTGLEDEPMGCLPNGLIAGIRCQGDGVCDIAEIHDPSLCPDDNCGAE